MSGDGYTYTSLSAHLGEPVQVGVSFYLDDRAWICVAGAGKDRPHLVVSHGDVSVSISTAGEQVTPEDAQIARRLADHAATYAAELERLCAASQDSAPDCGAAGDEAAGDPAA